MELILLIVLTGGLLQSQECGIFPAQATSPYVLPYPVGDQHRVWRTYTHYTAGNKGVGLFAIDFEMPINSRIAAARAGVVVAARDSFPDNNNIDLQENYVMVRHADGTIARYLHLTRGGALVKVGDRVRAGQVIARSGNSGQSTGPHLHFDVQMCGPNLPPSYNRLPCGRTVPVSFRNARQHLCGLEPGGQYRAGAITAVTDPDRFDRSEAGVKEALYHYLLGHATGEAKYFQRAFDEDGALHWVRDGKRMRRTAQDYIAGAPGKPATDEAGRRRVVSHIAIAADIASARVTLFYPTATFTDLMTLVYANDEWRIAAKAYTTSRATLK